MKNNLNEMEPVEKFIRRGKLVLNHRKIRINIGLELKLKKILPKYWSDSIDISHFRSNSARLHGLFDDAEERAMIANFWNSKGVSRRKFMTNWEDFTIWLNKVGGGGPVPLVRIQKTPPTEKGGDTWEIKLRSGVPKSLFTLTDLEFIRHPQTYLALCGWIRYIRKRIRQKLATNTLPGIKRAYWLMMSKDHDKLIAGFRENVSDLYNALLPFKDKKYEELAGVLDPYVKVEPYTEIASRLGMLEYEIENMVSNLETILQTKRRD